VIGVEIVKTFELFRDTDETGVSGTGLVAEGAVFSDGTCVLHWLTARRSTAVYGCLDDLLAIHGHNGKTRILYTGDPHDRGRMDCIQDSCENVPFASIGGLEARVDLGAPKYISPSESERYLHGYVTVAHELYGSDWRTCSFAWKPALTIESTDSAESPVGDAVT
jgi:hypothetical protein